jgi:hypothetical protein
MAMLVSLLLTSGDNLSEALELALELICSEATSDTKKSFLCRLALRQASASIERMAGDRLDLVRDLVVVGAQLSKSGFPQAEELLAEVEAVERSLLGNRATTADAEAQTEPARPSSAYSESTRASPAKPVSKPPSNFLQQVRHKSLGMTGKARLAYLQTVTAEVQQLVALALEHDLCTEALLKQQLEVMEHKYCS